MSNKRTGENALKELSRGDQLDIFDTLDVNEMSRVEK